MQPSRCFHEQSVSVSFSLTFVFFVSFVSFVLAPFRAFAPLRAFAQRNQFPFRGAVQEPELLRGTERALGAGAGEHARLGGLRRDRAIGRSRGVVLREGVRML
jgi:hypothetical protein